MWVLALLACGLVMPGVPARTGQSKPQPASATKQQAPAKGQETSAKSQETAAGKSEINLERAVAVAIPHGAELKAVAFKTPDGKTGWAVRIPGGRPIATPAYANGLLFFGGGYGSHEFYALDAQTGAVAWKINTGDDGPTAAVVEDGYVVFNTESCTLMVVDAKTGKLIWQKWLGDPLMSQPAVYRGRVYIAYPAGNPRSDVKPSGAIREGADERRNWSHRLLSLDLRTGAFIWEQEIPGDVISAPVISDGVVYITCFNGDSFAFQAADGKLLWWKKNAATSAPVVADGQVVHTMKEMANGRSYEGLKRTDAKKGDEKDKDLLAKEKAEYLAEGRGGGVALNQAQTAALDSSVGFGSAPASAKLAEASKNVGVKTVVGAWAYQGSRAAVKDGRIVNAQGGYVNALSSADGKVLWRAKVTGMKGEDQQVFAPPAMGGAYMYLAGADGFLASVSQRDGKAGFLYRVDHPIVFQPALASGNMYVGTADGWMLCLKTGSADADGWYAWGGNAQHNK